MKWSKCSPVLQKQLREPLGGTSRAQAEKHPTGKKQKPSLVKANHGIPFGLKVMKNGDV